MESTMSWKAFAGIAIRHGMTILGGWLVAEGLADAGMVDALTGGAVALTGIAFSVAEKKSR